MGRPSVDGGGGEFGSAASAPAADSAAVDLRDALRLRRRFSGVLYSGEDSRRGGRRRRRARRRFGEAVVVVFAEFRSPLIEKTNSTNITEQKKVGIFSVFPIGMVKKYIYISLLISTIWVVHVCFEGKKKKKE